MSASTQARLKQHGLEVDSLPEIEEILPIQLRTPTDLARRALALHALLGVIFHPQPRAVSEWLRAQNFLHELTEREQQVFALTELPDEEMQWRQASLQSNILTWRAESLYVLLWASGKIEHLVEPDERMDGALVADHLPELGEPLQPFIQETTLRPRHEILAELHYYFFLNHCLADIYEQYGESINGLDPVLVAERCEALHWVACADHAEWDADDS